MHVDAHYDEHMHVDGHLCCTCRIAGVLDGLDTVAMLCSNSGTSASAPPPTCCQLLFVVAMAASSSSWQWVPKAHAPPPAASQGSTKDAAKTGAPTATNLWVATYNVGAPEDQSHSNPKNKPQFTNKLVSETVALCDRFHVIFLQEISLGWSMILAEHLPEEWTLLYGEGAYATIFKNKDWATDPAVSQEDVKIFQDKADNDNPYRHWRRYFKVD